MNDYSDEEKLIAAFEGKTLPPPVADDSGHFHIGNGHARPIDDDGEVRQADNGLSAKGGEHIMNAARRKVSAPPSAAPSKEKQKRQETGSVELINGMGSLHLGDCIQKLKLIEDASVDLVLTDLPYGTTACPWDFVIPPDDLWEQLHRVGKENAAFVFTAAQPFSWRLCASNPEEFRYSLVWEKPNGTSPFQARIMPMKRHEDILVFYRKLPTYNPQMEKGKPYKWNSRRSGGEAGGIKQTRETPIDNDGTRFPTSILRFGQERGLHPTQKPVALMEWLVKTYSNEGQTVLDCTMGSGTTGVAALGANRRFIGIERDQSFFRIAVERMTGK
jgi:site-specific DNA-methyltransferase (adenine-specific)